MGRATCGYGLMLVLILVLFTGIARAASIPLPRNAPWYNTSRALTWDDLEGRAVLLDFFSPGCINCIHMLPVEEKLARKFGKHLVIIGVDSPKFTNSATKSGLVDFITVHNVRHPVTLDVGHQLWNAWDVFAWPTLALIGPDGQPLGRFIGEQSFEKLSTAIKSALTDAPPATHLTALPLAPMTSGHGMLSAPGGLAVSKQWVAISDTGHNRVILADHSGKVATVIGGDCANNDDEAVFSRPHGLAFHNGKLYVANTEGQTIRTISLDSHKVTTLAGNGHRAYVASGDFRATDAPFNSPWDVQWVHGKLFVSMAGDHDIWRYDPTTNRIGPWAGTGREGLRDGRRGTAEFAQPSGLDAYKNSLYVADAESSAIRVIHLDTGRVGTPVGQGLFKFGLQNGPARQALLQHAQSMIRLGNALYIADTFNDAIRRLDLETHQVSTVARPIAHPHALAALTDNTLLIAAAGANRLVTVNLATGKKKPWHLKGLDKAPRCHGS